MKYIFIALLLLYTSSAFPQKNDPDKILDEVKENFSRIKDYEVNVSIKIDVSMLKAPDSKAKIYYKQPDKIHIKSESFAIVPREGLDFSPLSLLKGKYTAIYDRKENLDGVNTDVIKVIPIADQSDIVLTSFWIDREKKMIRKIESNTKIAGTFTILLKYDKSVGGYPLPSSMEFSFQMENMNMQRGMHDEPDKNKKEKPAKGKVYITYWDYKINKGIPDSIFEEKKK